MLDVFNTPAQNAESFYFEANAFSTLAPFVWSKPRGKSMIDIILVGYGGNGGAGAVGANNAAAGGGGGASGAMACVRLPLHILPDNLYIFLFPASSAAASIVSIEPNTNNPISRIASAGGGGNGGAAVGATPGAAGTLPAGANTASMPLGFIGTARVFGGQAGAVGSANQTGTAITLPTSGLLVTGGAGGAGVFSPGQQGYWGGQITGSGVFPTIGDQNTTIDTVPGFDGSSGNKYGMMWYGGCGGGSSTGSATGAGLKGGNGGNGAPGCGGGGGGGCLTGGTAGVGGRGGPAFCIITCW